MQYTGLKDKNGIEIYEGDIISHYAFNHQKSFFIEDAVSWDDFYTGFVGPGLASEWSSCEVVGNIHENPELLEG